MNGHIHPIADLHTHTLFSAHAYSTITENAAAAARNGMIAIACTDHTDATPDSGYRWHFSNMDILPPMIEGVRVLHGMESNVMDFTGNIDVSAERRHHMDIVIASMHAGTMPTGTVDEITAAWSAIAADPDVDIIGHSGTPCYRYEYETVIPLFGHYGKVVEVNEGTFRVRRDSYENCKRIVQLCKQHDVRIAMGSDAHFHEHVGRFEHVIALLEELDFPPELIVNGSRESLVAYLREKNLTL